jgi:O-Antigen ligase
LNSNHITYLKLVFFHFLLGLLIFVVPVFAKIYGFAIVIISLFYIIQKQNKGNEVLYAAAYFVGIEVLFRMTGGFIFNEFAKYWIIYLMIMGMYYSKFSKDAYFYWIFMVLLLPGIFYASVTLNLKADLRKEIAFNMSGPFCLAFASVYCYKRKITLTELENILLSSLLPIISIVTYMYFFAPNIKNVVRTTASNFTTSGGFGPNQVSTILGLGVFIIFARLLFNSKSAILFFVNVIILLILTFRGIVTFSRGGMITAGIMILILLYSVFRISNQLSKLKIVITMLVSFFILLIIWNFSSNQTNGMIEKRYANQDASGRLKKDKLGGREEINGYELDMFFDNPILGVGAGKNMEIKEQIMGDKVATHNEITRMLAEHGTFGILGLLLLFLVPILSYLNNKTHIYLFALFGFWLFTINHAAMRLAAPCFIYALSLLKVSIKEK